ncbi:hypothetical protein C900_02420 [Fulvivirga imtechensis AK7]|uniref:Phosphoribosyltransferase domain-containing protein n=1 Tax=Fulvivirga imtechensis AK7 TaxID=1237149 RepID=L8JWM3_9BACT|nr:phosphoribosyltransferase family protein [Fulvivirga imtechensis]ELR71612.1 hypothetical protein C900_02420 [Fulvivirga imtechensis AK7]
MFKDRKDAGVQLAKALGKYEGQNVLILGIPRGGVETAYYVAKHLNAEMSVVVTRKLGYPYNPEAAFGAIAEDGSVYISDAGKQMLADKEINEVMEREKAEVQRRLLKLRQGRPLPKIQGRTVIIVDDGIATGATLFATIELCRHKKAAKIVVAAPISDERMKSILHRKADDVVILETPPFYRAVSQGYRDFSTVSDQQALEYLDKWEKEYEEEFLN